MGRGLGYQNQSYGYSNDGGMWMDQSQAQQQQHYAVYQESWGSPAAMHVKPPPSYSSSSASGFYGGGGGGGFGMHQQSFEDASFGSADHHHDYGAFARGPNKFNPRGNNHFEEVAEYDRSGHSEQRYGYGYGYDAAMKQGREDETRFERHNYGFNPYNPARPPYPHPQYWAEKRIV